MKTNLSTILSIAFLLSFSVAATAQELSKTNPASQSEELGKVEWHRDYNQATQLAKETGKPILILFQEVPGCSTCRNYGHNVLSHPLMVEAIENEFIPLAIYNNKGGADRQILKKFGEPSWNNPVVRIVDVKGNDLVKRVSGNYSAKGLYSAMEKALKSTKHQIPEYMILLGKEVSSVQTQEKCYSMYCFWSGEKHLGNAKGVLKTEAGFANHKEVVKVTYNPNTISEEELDRFAKTGSCSPMQEAKFRFSNKDHLFYLKQSNYQYIPLSTIQQTVVNSALGNRTSPLKYLSPSQQKWLQEIQDKKRVKESFYHLELAEAWLKMNEAYKG
jgi:hypothetical protein